MKYAIARVGGKQLKIAEGKTYKLEAQKALKFDILAYFDGKELTLGAPFVEGITIKATVVEEKKDRKVRVARFKSKSRYDKVKGHRQPITVFKIEEIIEKGEKKAEKVEAPVKKEKATETKKKTVKSSTKKEKAE